MIDDETYERCRKAWEDQGCPENPDALRLMQVAVDAYFQKILKMAG